LGTFWLKIEQFWPFEEISIFSHGGHLGNRRALTDTFSKGTTQGSFQPSLVEIGTAVSEEKNFFRKCTNLNCISIMMSFLTYITGFFYEL
jgi:hypothetical protein